MPIAIRACRPAECPHVLALWREAEATLSPTDSMAALQRLLAEPNAFLRERGAGRITALVEQDHPWAVGFWDSLTGEGYRRDPRIIRYVGTLSPER